MRVGLCFPYYIRRFTAFFSVPHFQRFPACISHNIKLMATIPRNYVGRMMNERIGKVFILDKVISSWALLKHVSCDMDSVRYEIFTCVKCQLYLPHGAKTENTKCSNNFGMPGLRIKVNSPILPILTLKLVAMATSLEPSEKGAKSAI